MTSPNAAALPAVRAPESPEEDDVRRLKALPKELGLLLVVIGLGGIMLPGPVGSPFLLMGGVVLWPRAFERLERGFSRRFPKVHRQSMKQLDRFVADLERRYPR